MKYRWLFHFDACRVCQWVNMLAGGALYGVPPTILADFKRRRIDYFALGHLR